MKRGLILSAIALAVSMSASAQMLPDSTVQIVAHWSKGDKIAYDCTTTSYDADGNDNRSNVSATSETRIFEVLDKREDGYTLRLSYKNVFSPNPVEGLTPEETKEIGENLTITFNTDEFGSVTEIVNSEESIAILSDMIDIIIERKWKEMDKKTRKALPKDQFSNSIKSLFCSDDVLILTASADITPFFNYHGTRLDTTQVYTFPQEFTFPLAGEQPFNVDTELWVDSELTDETSAVIRTDAFAAKETLFPMLMDYSIQIAKAATGGKNISEDDIASAREELDKRFVDLTMEVYTTTEIHLSSGWPIQWYNTKEVVIVNQDKTIKKVVEQSAMFSEEQY